MKSYTFRGVFSTSLFDSYKNLIEEGDTIIYTPVSRWSTPSIYKVLKLTENGVDTLCICVNGIYYTSYYLSSRCILIEKKDGTLVNHGHSFDTKGNTI